MEFILRPSGRNPSFAILRDLVGQYQVGPDTEGEYMDLATTSLVLTNDAHPPPNRFRTKPLSRQPQRHLPPESLHRTQAPPTIGRLETTPSSLDFLGGAGLNGRGGNTESRGRQVGVIGLDLSCAHRKVGLLASLPSGTETQTFRGF